MAQLDSTTWLATTAPNQNNNNSAAAGPVTAPNRGAGDPHNVVKSREDQLGQQQQHGQSFEDVAQQQQRGLLKIPSSVGKCSMFTQTENNR
jgi:hypothetical protein